jgi:small subunit ribosomal protein S18
MVEFERRKRKTCRFCENKVDHIDYKDERLLRKFITDRGKIVPRRISGNCAWHQRRLTVAVKRARHLALLPFTGEVYR